MLITFEVFYMETTLNFNLPMTFQQVTEIVRQLPEYEKIQLSNLLKKEVKKENDTVQTHFASQATLSQDWLDLEEEKAWQHL